MGRRGLTVGVPLAVVGCISSVNLLDTRGSGTARCYRIDYETLWPIVEESVRWVGLMIESAHEENGFILARSYEPEVEDPEDMALDADQGENVAVFVEPEGEDVYAVEVVSRSRFPLDPTPRDWTDALFLAFEDRLPAAASAPSDDLAACARVRGLSGR
ncbi:MAG: hypothetical protein MJB57_02450 [Gemmatimonadetes bacterium]|nr:hypothetical protein [Gemmatimonadota bacterium]